VVPFDEPTLRRMQERVNEIIKEKGTGQRKEVVEGRTQLRRKL